MPIKERGNQAPASPLYTVRCRSSTCTYGSLRSATPYTGVHSSLVVACYLQLAAGVYCVIKITQQANTPQKP